MNIKAILTDVDGTLIDFYGSYHQSTPSLIQELRKRGIYVGVATGKMYSGEVARLLQELQLSPLNIFCGGGLILDWKTEEAVLHRPISIESSRKIIEYLNTTNVVFSIETKDHAYMIHIVDTPAYTKDIVVQPFTLTSIPENPLKILIHAYVNKLSEDEIMKHMKHIQNDCKDVEIIKFVLGEFYGMDITSEASTKHTAVLEYAKILGISPKEIVAIGDGYNDYPLFTACRYKIAMGNAPKELKEIADKIVGTAQEGGMKQALEHIISLCP